MSGCILCGADSNSETTVQKVLALLLALEEAVPPAATIHHNLTAIEESLVLSVSRGEIWQTCDLDEDDLDKPNAELIAEIEALYEEPVSKDE